MADISEQNVYHLRDLLDAVQETMDTEHVRLNSGITAEEDVMAHGRLTRITLWEKGRTDIFAAHESVLPIAHVDIIRVLLKANQDRPERIVELSIRLYSLHSEYYNETMDDFVDTEYFLVVFELNSRYKTDPNHVIHRVQKMYFDNSLAVANAFSGPDDVEFRAMMRNGPMTDYLDLSRSGRFDPDIRMILSEPHILRQVFLAFSRGARDVGQARPNYEMERKM